ncbi:putative quinol monooxygenase [Rhodococcus globerulus]|uniref:Antibiotic biosynthesis monooxygenase n=1 Tax=Rhodococcus globerulus TaxID=33008 RepID=A0ABU4C507_RHOGO|nr:antibiotic biosynthesis monooxygenase [Rhodococcus globerulus]MDV6271603.1 antibiotic biosynthesis monooxygenase [Rhodococcus globerulus]
MIVLHVSFRIDSDPNDFREWFGGLAKQTRGVRGCIKFEFLIDATDPRRIVTIEVWENAQARESYFLLPHHVEMVALGSEKWGMHSFQVSSWPNAGACSVNERTRSDEPVAGRSQMNRLVRDFADDQLT